MGALLAQVMENGIGDSVGAVIGLEEEGAAELIEVEGHEGFDQRDSGAGVGAIFFGQVASSGCGDPTRVDLFQGFVGLWGLEPVLEGGGAGGGDFV